MRFFWRKRRDEELDEELRAHLAMAIRDRVERGEDPATAEAEARREFGNVALVTETTRDMWGWTWLEQTGQDIRYALRGMRRSPGFTAVAVLSLALGIGATTSIFSLMYAAMLRTLPVRAPGELVELMVTYPGEPRRNGYWSQRAYAHYQARATSFSAMIGAGIDNLCRVQTGSGEAEDRVGEHVTSNYFREFGLRPAMGRLIGSEHDAAKPEGAVAVVSWTLWMTRLDGQAGAIGKPIQVDGKPVTVIGVAPRGFHGLRSNARTDVWVPAGKGTGLNLIARLRPGATIDQARAEMSTLFQFTIEERAASSTDPQVRKMRVELEHCATGLNVLRDQIGKPLTVLMAVVGVLLLLACANIAGLLLARSAGRGREMALRLGLGASRWRLLRQVLTESVLLSAFGAVGGMAIAYAGTQALLVALAKARPHEQVRLEVQPDGTLLAFAIGLTLLTGVLFGLLPAWKAFRAAPVLSLRQTGGAVETHANRASGRVLLAAQVALSVLLLSTAAQFLWHLASLKSADLGFQRDHVLLVQLDPSGSGFRGPRLANAYRELLGGLAGVPGVLNASLGAPTPLQGAGASAFAVAEGAVERPEDRRWISMSFVSPRYFATLGTPLLAGRDFDFADADVLPRRVIINETLANHYFAGRDPLGKRITLDHMTGRRDAETFVIIGVTADANYYEMREKERRALFLPAFGRERVGAHTLVIRTGIDPEAAGADVRRAIQQHVPGATVSRMATLEEQVDAVMLRERLMAGLSGFFGLLGAVLAGIGVYGLLAYMVTRRTGEIGIRLALGATPGGVAAMVAREALLVTAAGLAIGIPLAIWGGRVAHSLLEGLPERGIWLYAAGGGGIAAVALLAAFLPARRAARVDPMVSLRHE